ncbi:hypothetical protein BDW71DRAFT_188188 [Aspergillus fruticulosus]
MGQDANCVIEDAAVLATLLDQLVRSDTKSIPSNVEIESLLSKFKSRGMLGQRQYTARPCSASGSTRVIVS